MSPNTFDQESLFCVQTSIGFVLFSRRWNAQEVETLVPSLRPSQDSASSFSALPRGSGHQTLTPGRPWKVTEVTQGISKLRYVCVYWCSAVDCELLDGTDPLFYFILCPKIKAQCLEHRRFSMSRCRVNE